jgi:hypothetical protein
MQAWSVIPTARIEGVLDSVRNNVLTFALELEAIGIGANEEQIKKIDEPTSDRYNADFSSNVLRLRFK